MTIPIYKNAKDMFDHSTSISPTNDFIGKIKIFNEENAIIQTELFDIDSLRYYAKKNCGLNEHSESNASTFTNFAQKTIRSKSKFQLFNLVPKQVFKL